MIKGVGYTSPKTVNFWKRNCVLGLNWIVPVQCFLQKVRPGMLSRPSRNSWSRCRQLSSSMQIQAKNPRSFVCVQHLFSYLLAWSEMEWSIDWDCHSDVFSQDCPCFCSIFVHIATRLLEPPSVMEKHLFRDSIYIYSENFGRHVWLANGNRDCKRSPQAL